MNNKLFRSALCLALVLILALSTTISAFAANSEDAIVIYDINITNIAVPYAGETPKYTCNLNSNAYYLDSMNNDDYDVINGLWWYDETTGLTVDPDSEFIKGHDYSISMLLWASDGYEFRVDEDDNLTVKATVNGETAIVDKDFDKYWVFVEYTFENCDYSPIVNEVELDVTAPVAGEYPDFYPELLTQGVTIGYINSPYAIDGVAWYDYTTQTFMNYSDKFVDGHVYEINVAVETLGDLYFPTDANGDAAVVGYVNGNKATTETAGETGRYYARICYAFGDKRQEVSHVDVTGVTAPSVGAIPDFTVADTAKYYINAVYWTDVTTSSRVNLKETDVFVAGHTYELEIWLRAHDNYKFRTDSDGWIDITATIGGKQAEVVPPGAHNAAIITVTYTLNKPQVVSFVDVSEIDAPVAGELPDMEAYCSTQGCNVDTVEWYDVTDGTPTLISADTKFVEGRVYRVVVSVVAEGNTTFEMVDGYNEATGDINGNKAIVYGSHDERVLELGYEFPACQKDDSFILGDVDGDGKVSVLDAAAIQRHIASIKFLTDDQLKRADTDKDGKVSVLDAAMIQRLLAHIIPGF